jgi:hypothetical protein
MERAHVEHTWNVFGTHLPHNWNRLDLEHIWNTVWNTFEHMRKTFGTHGTHVDAFGTYLEHMERIWNRSGTDLEHIWNTFGAQTCLEHMWNAFEHIWKTF